VLAPEWNIDGWYLGKEEVNVPDYSLVAGLDEHVESLGGQAKAGRRNQPSNIAPREFRLLNERLQLSGLSFSHKDSHLKNNTSVVLLLEWRGKRLLFTGDAEWEGRPVSRDHKNGAWDVLLERDKKNKHLAKPLDFMKVGHHGSVNGTPFDRHTARPAAALDKFLPVGGDARVVVSTVAGEHGETYPVPYDDLMKELGRRASNATKYPDCHEMPSIKQPQRTDHDTGVTDNGVTYIEVKIQKLSSESGFALQQFRRPVKENFLLWSGYFPGR